MIWGLNNRLNKLTGFFSLYTSYYMATVVVIINGRAQGIGTRRRR